MTSLDIIPNDDDRVYMVNANWLRANVVRLPDDAPTTFEMLPTPDPDKYVMRVTVPAPKFLIKTVNFD